MYAETFKVHKLSTILGTEASSNLVSTPGFHGMYIWW